MSADLCGDSCTVENCLARHERDLGVSGKTIGFGIARIAVGVLRDLGATVERTPHACNPDHVSVWYGGPDTKRKDKERMAKKAALLASWVREPDPPV